LGFRQIKLFLSFIFFKYNFFSTGNAIWAMTNQGFSTSYGARADQNVTRVGIVITDGESQGF
jgi:hypothetical protein